MEATIHFRIVLDDLFLKIYIVTAAMQCLRNIQIIFLMNDKPLASVIEAEERFETNLDQDLMLLVMAIRT